MASAPLLDALIDKDRSSTHTSQCCCGSPDCAYLRHGQEAVEGLEKDVKDAARVGQALLVRHEAYVADVERERSRMTNTLTNLETDHKALQGENERLVKENRTLLDQVEELNTSVEDSDTHVKSLTVTLQSTNQELQRVRNFAARAENLEIQLLELETEQVQLRNSLSNSREEERAANARWHSTQRLLADLEAQVETIEKEAREDRQRHAEIVERLEKRKAVEKVLDKPNGTRSDERNNEVVSGFVKEILEDNANLQLSMAEIQELLMRSKEETEFLRNQLAEAQTAEEVEESRDNTPTPTLNHEIPMPERQIAQEFHVHHHYHAPNAVQIQRIKPTHQRPRRRRPGLANAGSGRSTPTTTESHSRVQSIASSAPSMGPAHSARPSFTLSSDPSSPQSASYAPSTIFEYTSDIDRTETSSRPTSPESSAVFSPVMKPSHSKQGSDDSAFFQPLPMTTAPHSFSIEAEGTRARHRKEGKAGTYRASIETSPTRFTGGDATTMAPNLKSYDFNETTNYKEHTPRKSNNHYPATIDDADDDQDTPKQPQTSHALRRNPSTSSLYSISGMDIHSTFPAASTPSRADQLPPFISLRSKPSLNFSTDSSPSVNDPVLTAATASASKGSSFKDGGSILREKFGASVKSGASTKESPKGNASGEESTYAPLMDTFGRRVGGWLSNKWTTNAGQSHEHTREAASLNSSVSVSDLRGETASQRIVPNEPASSPATPSRTSKRKSSQAVFQRAPGINQSGALPIPQRVFKPVVRRLDEGALKESLADIVEDECFE